MGALKPPHGGELKNLYLEAEEAAEEKVRSKDLKSWDLTPRQMCDIELILNGGFSPLEGFLGRADYESVVSNMRIADNRLNGGKYLVSAGAGAGAEGGLRITGNRLGRDFSSSPRRLGEGVLWSGNVWADTGELVP